MKRNPKLHLPLYVVSLFVICLVTLAGSAVTNYQNLQRLKVNNASLEHSWRVSAQLRTISLLIRDTEAGLRGYYLTGAADALRPWNTVEARLAAELGTLDQLVADNPVQQRNLVQLRSLVEQKIQRFEENTRLFEQAGLAELVKVVKENDGMDVTDEIGLIDTIMQKEEAELLASRRDNFLQEYSRSIWIGGLINGVAILVLLFFFLLIRHGFLKQKAIEETLKTANDTLEATVQTRTEQLSFLSRHLLKVAEKERASLARELHDEMGSLLTVISMQMSAVMGKLKQSDPVAASQLESAKSGLVDVIHLKRRIIENLRPSTLDNLGLAASIRSHYEEVAGLAGLKLELDISDDSDQIDPDWTIVLYRIAQEVLNNTVKYAKASQVKLTLRSGSSGWWLQIADNGIGIAMDEMKKPKSHGLLGMRERASLIGGVFAIRRGASNRGTVIEVTIPYPPKEVLAAVPAVNG